MGTEVIQKYELDIFAFGIFNKTH